MLYFFYLDLRRISGETASDKDIHESVCAQMKKAFAKSKWKVSFSSSPVPSFGVFYILISFYLPSFPFFLLLLSPPLLTSFTFFIFSKLSTPRPPSTE